MSDNVLSKKRSTRTAWIITAVFGLLILIPSMMGFVMKFIELIVLVKGETTEASEGAFAVTPVVNYLMASLGFFCLLVWAAMNGMFRDIEAPKHFMLEQEAELDRVS